MTVACSRASRVCLATSANLSIKVSAAAGRCSQACRQRSLLLLQMHKAHGRTGVVRSNGERFVVF